MATDVGFYHLTRMPLERALPRLLQRVLDAGLRAVVLGTSEERLKALDVALWVDDPGAFLAHGLRGEPRPQDQPIYLTAVEENPNGAQVLVLIDGAEPGYVASFERCLDVFDGNDPAAVAAARARYRVRKAAGFSLAYWQQDAAGRWAKVGGGA